VGYWVGLASNKNGFNLAAVQKYSDTANNPGYIYTAVKTSSGFIQSCALFE
jgi:hypothetical protein